MTKYRGTAVIAFVLFGMTAAIVGQGLAQQAATEAAKDADANPINPQIAAALKGTWTNQLKSVLEITSVDPTTGAVSGKYQTLKKDGTLSDRYPLNGWVNTTAAENNSLHHVTVVEFSVRWGTVGSITAWNGYYDLSGKSPAIVGQWLLARPNSQATWDHILAGQDTFTKN